MSKENMVSLLNSFNLNKPLEVSLVFDDSDEESNCSNNQETKSTQPADLNLNAPLEVTLVFDDSDEQISPNHKLKDNDKNSCALNKNDKNVIISEFFNTTPEESKTQSSVKKYIEVNQQKSLEVHPKGLNLDKSLEDSLIKDKIENKNRTDIELNINDKEKRKRKNNGKPKSSKCLSIKKKTKFESCLGDKKVVSQKDCLQDHFLNINLEKPVENSSSINEFNALISSNKNNPEGEQLKSSHEHLKNLNDERKNSELDNSRPKKLEAVLENKQIDTHKHSFRKSHNVTPATDYNIYPERSNNSNYKTPIHEGVNVGDNSNKDYSMLESNAKNRESQDTTRNQENISLGDINKDCITQSSVNNEYVDCDNYLTLMLKTVTDHLIVILQAYNCLVSSRSPGVTELDPNKVSEAEKNFQKIKEHFYNLSYSTVANVMLPQEKNSQFIQKFISDCVALSKNQFQYSQFLTVYKDLLQWVKIKKQCISELPFGKSFDSLQNANPILADQLSQPFQVPVTDEHCDKKTNGNITPETSSTSQNPSLCIFSSDSNAGKVTINVDTRLLQHRSQANLVPCSSAPVNATSTIASNNFLEYSQTSVEQRAAEYSQEIVNGISKYANSIVSNTRPSPYPQYSPLHSVRLPRHGALNSGAANQQTGCHATPFNPRALYRASYPYLSSSSVVHPANYNSPPRFSSTVRQPQAYHSLMTTQNNLPIEKKNHLSSNKYLQNRVIQSENYIGNFPPQSLPKAKPALAQSRSQEFYNNFLSNQAGYPANQISLARAARQPPSSKTQNSKKNLPPKATYSNMPPTSLPISRPPPPAYKSPGSPINPPWQKTHDVESLEDQNKSTRCQSTDSGFVSPFQLQSPTETLVRQETQNAPPTPLITHVTSLNPKAAHNNEGMCLICHKTTNLKCLGCHSIYYCSYNCQVKDWGRHERECQRP